jgi:hypothetical protein
LPPRIGPYTDPNLTTRNAETLDPPAINVPGPNASTTDNVRRYYAADQQTEIESVEAATENADVAAPPPATPSWKISTDAQGIPRSRDPYRNNGMTGQSFFSNQGV